jgi:hypothetical protein
MVELREAPDTLIFQAGRFTDGGVRACCSHLGRK